MRIASEVLAVLVAIAAGRKVQAFIAAPATYTAARLQILQRNLNPIHDEAAGGLSYKEFEDFLKRRNAGLVESTAAAERRSEKDKVSM
jgi:hypothetical protein